MRILYIANSSEIGGGNRSLETLTTGVRERDIEPVIMVPDQGEAKALFQSHGLPVEVFDIEKLSFKRPLEALSKWFKLRKILKQHRISLVHANGTLAARAISPLTRLMGLPLVTHVRFDLGAAYYRWAFRNLPLPNHFIFVSHYMKSAIWQHIRRSNKSSASVVHNAVRPIDKPAPAPAQYVNTIGVVANLQKVKGHEDFLRMAKILLERHAHLKFHIVGGDVQKQGRKEELEGLCDSLGISDRIAFTGFVRDVIQEIDKLDVVVCPSLEEPFGRCAIEGMQRGKPVIVTRVGGLPEIVNDEENGFVVTPGNPDELAEAVKKIIAKGLDVFFKPNQQRIEHQFSQKMHVDQITEIYSKLIN